MRSLKCNEGKVEAALEPLRSLDWDNIDAMQTATRQALVSLIDIDRDPIRTALQDLPRRPELLALCEHHDVLDIVVLWDDPTGFQVCLHVFPSGYSGRAHNHRWSYASTILRGRYRHFLFGDVELDEDKTPDCPEAITMREELAGRMYALHHSMVHAVVAEPYTVSLVIRGPAVKDRFLVMNRKTGESWWQYGAKQESPAEAAPKRMTAERLHELRELLGEWGVF